MGDYVHGAKRSSCVTNLLLTRRKAFGFIRQNRQFIKLVGEQINFIKTQFALRIVAGFPGFHAYGRKNRVTIFLNGQFIIFPIVIIA